MHIHIYKLPIKAAERPHWFRPLIYSCNHIGLVFGNMLQARKTFKPMTAARVCFRNHMRALEAHLQQRTPNSTFKTSFYLLFYATKQTFVRSHRTVWLHITKHPEGWFLFAEDAPISLYFIRLCRQQPANIFISYLTSWIYDVIHSIHRSFFTHLESGCGGSRLSNIFTRKCLKTAQFFSYSYIVLYTHNPKCFQQRKKPSYRR